MKKAASDIYVLVQTHGLVLKKPYVKTTYTDSVKTSYTIPANKQLTVIHGSPNSVCYLGDDAHDEWIKRHITRVLEEPNISHLEVVLDILRTKVKPSILQGVNEMSPDPYVDRIRENIDRFFQLKTYGPGSRKKNKEFAKTSDEPLGITIYDPHGPIIFDEYRRIDKEIEKWTVIESEFVTRLFDRFDHIILIDLSCSQSSDETSPKWDLHRGYEGSQSSIQSVGRKKKPKSRTRKAHSL
jgi:hypothetical protein